MYKNILLTIDLNHSASWKVALPESLALARASGGKLHVLAVVPDFGSPVVAGFFPKDFKDKALHKAQAELDALMKSDVPGDVSAQGHIAYGTIHEEILKAIDHVGADLVVMASHAPEAIREFLVGSQADRVVRRSPVSVLVVRG